MCLIGTMEGSEGETESGLLVKIKIILDEENNRINPDCILR